MDLSERWRSDAAELREFAAAQHAYPRAFLTLSGADLYGFPSIDGDYDLRGAHVLPLRAFNRSMLTMRGMEKTPDLTIEAADKARVPDLDFVSHDLGKMLRLALKANGYILEQILSPQVIETSLIHARLVEFAPRLITRRLYHHYNGFFSNQERLYDSRGVKRVKGLLYQYRVALTGIHVLRSGEIEANIVRLNESFKSPLIAELIERKQSGETLTLEDDSRFRAEIAGLAPALLDSHARSRLNEEHDGTLRADLEALLWECRTADTAGIAQP